MSDIDVILNPADIAFLGLLGNRQLRNTALKACRDRVELFPELRYPMLHKAWGIFLKTLTKDRNAGPQLIAGKLSEAIDDTQEFPEMLKARMRVILKRYVNGDLPSDEDASSALEGLVEQDTCRKVASCVSMNAGIAQLRSMLDVGLNRINELKSDESKDNDKVVYMPFEEIDKLAVVSKRIPTGIDWLDALSNGGGRAGELWLILGASGAGKSQFTVQYACAQALMQRCTVWATYEQSLAGDLAERIIANVTDTSLDRIRDKGFNGLAKDIQNKFRMAVELNKQNLVGLDMTHAKPNKEDPDDNGGVYSVWQYVKELKRKGKQVFTVIIDWFGAMMSIISGITGQDLDGAYRFIAQHEINLALQMAKEEDILVIFLHQTDSQAQHAKPTYSPDKTQAKDMHDMSHYMDLVFTMGNRDEHDICWFAAAKSRKGNPMKRTVKLIGEKVRFEDAPGWRENRNGSFYNPAEDYSRGAQQQPSQSASAFTREVD